MNSYKNRASELVNAKELVKLLNDPKIKFADLTKEQKLAAVCLTIGAFTPVIISLFNIGFKATMLGIFLGFPWSFLPILIGATAGFGFYILLHKIINKIYH